MYSNFRRITHRFRNTSCFNAENHSFAHSTCIILSLNVTVIGLPVECGDKIWRQKTRIIGLPYGKELVIVGRTRFAQSMHECDRQTGRFTMIKTALCIASRGKTPWFLECFKCSAYSTGSSFPSSLS